MEKKLIGGGNSLNFKKVLILFLSIFFVFFSGVFLTACGEDSSTEYQIVLMDEDKVSVLYAQKIPAGDAITGVPTPTKDSDDEYTYTFAGWADANGNRVILTFANSNITAYATYTATAKTYSLSIVSNDTTIYSYDQVTVTLDGAELTSGSSLHYGDLLEITVNGTEGYTISGNVGYEGLQRVTQDGKTYYKVVGNVTISFTEEANTYTVRLLNYDKSSTFQTLSATYGSNVLSQVNIPTRETTLRGSYVFDCWLNLEDDSVVDLTKVTSNITAYASYTESLISYKLTLTDSAHVTVYNGDEQLYSGSTIYYDDTLTVVTDTTTGYHISSLLATSSLDGSETDISSTLAFKVVGDMTISYVEAINMYTIRLFSSSTEYETYSIPYGTDMTEVSDYFSPSDPEKQGDETYTYVFVDWYNKDGTAVVDLSYITESVNAYAVFESVYVEYSLTLSDRVTVTMTSGSFAGETYTSDSVKPTMHYGDTFKVSYDLADGYSVNTFTLNGDTITANETQTMNSTSGVSIVFAMQKTFNAVSYQNLQRFKGFTGSDGTYVSAIYDDDTGKITNSSLTDGGAIISYIYVGTEVIDYTAEYEDFITMSGLTLYSGQSYTPTYKNGVYTTNGISNTGKIDIPLYKGMTIEFTITDTAMAQMNFGLSTADRIENAQAYTLIQGTQYYFSPTYNIWSYSTGSYLSTLAVTSSKSTTSEDTGEVTYTVQTGNFVLNSNYTFFGSIDVTIRLVLSDTMELYINNELISLDTSSSAVSDFEIADDTAYYFTIYGAGTHSINFTEFGYYENSELGYLEYLSGKTLTIIGDSITAGSGASNVYEEVDQETATCDSTATYYYLDDTATTTNSDGYASVTGLESFDADTTYYLMTSTKTENRYSNKLTSALGMTQSNLGLSNSGYCTGRPNDSGTDLSRINILDQVSTDSEIVVIFLGINDIRNSSASWGTLGDVDSTDTTTMYGAINTMYSTIVQMFEDAGKSPTVYVCNPTPATNDLDGTYTWGGGYTLQELSAAIQERAEHYGFNFIDLLNNCGFTADDYIDSVHPNNDGHATIASLIYDAIIENAKYTYNLD